MHPQVIIQGLRHAGELALKALHEQSCTPGGNVLEICAGTALNSKLIASQKNLFAPMAVEAVQSLDSRVSVCIVKYGMFLSCFLYFFITHSLTNHRPTLLPPRAVVCGGVLLYHTLFVFF